MEEDLDITVEDSIIQEYESSGEDFGDFMQEVQDHVQGLIKKHYKPPETNWEALQAFTHAINWSEPFIQGLIAFHLVLLTTVLMTRRSIEIQFILFCFVALMVFMSEQINHLGSTHWREFATQNYFDQSGIFIGIFMSGPFLLIALVQLVSDRSNCHMLLVMMGVYSVDKSSSSSVR